MTTITFEDDKTEYFAYHCVFRPSIEFLPSFDEMKSYLQKFKNLVNFTLSAEKGASNGKEEYNHYDIVLELNKDLRPDSIKRSTCTAFGLPQDSQRNIRVYRIDKDRSLYQLGYCIKEGIKSFSTLEPSILKEAGIYYKKHKKDFEKTKKTKKDKSWNLNDIGEEYIKWLQELPDYDGTITYSNAEGYFKEFLRIHRKFITLSTFHRLNKDKLFEYVSCEESEPKLILKTNVHQ